MDSNRKNIIAKMVNSDYNSAYETARQWVQRRGPPKGRGHGNGARKNYNVQRMESFRKVQSKITENDLAEELRKKLFPGLKGGQTAADRLEAVNTMKAITICITTRAIGFGTASIFTALFEFNNVLVNGSIYQMYRVGLAICECKMQAVQRGVVSILDNEEDYEPLRQNADFINRCKGFAVLPDQLSAPINAIGKVRLNERVYVQKIGKNNYSRNQRFIPQSEQITFSNLRETVEALADVQVPVQYRRRFYRNNSIPGTVWRNAPILVNGDENMPPNYCII